MKSYIILCSLLLMSFFLLHSCKKPQESDKPYIEIDSSIVFPEIVFFNQNILSQGDTLHLRSGDLWSFSAMLGKNAKLRLQVTDLRWGRIPSASDFEFDLTKLRGWRVTPRNEWTGIMDLYSVSTGSIDVPIRFLRKNNTLEGSLRIAIYENSSTSTVSKYVFWTW